MADLLTVMTFNVRGSQHQDGENEWPNRARLNVDCIRRCAPDLIGLQEFQEGNRKTYESELPGYESMLGPGYENHRPWAYNAIYWDPSRLTLLDSGGFWISEMPEKRSRSWDSSHVRSASWARFGLSSGAEFIHLNTHLDHKSGGARVEGSRLIISRLDELTGGALPALVTGDFNCGPGSETYGLYGDAGFSDAHRLAGNPPGHTFHRFRGEDFKPKNPGREVRLDWVLARDGVDEGWETQDCLTIRDAKPPVYPSDHYPVLASLSLTESSRSSGQLSV